MVATIGGILAGFKFESHAAELKVLAATAQSTLESLKTDYRKALCENDPGKKIESMKLPLDNQDNKVREVLLEAAKYTNITRKIIKQQMKEDEISSQPTANLISGKVA
jgi:hypothetical protein